jgi:chromate transporter
MMKLAAVVLLLWLLPLPLFYFFVGDFYFWRRLALFFTKTAFVTIGGSYTVIPYVAKVAVLKFHWLTRLQMMDGFALAETTPGPLIIVVAFVGFLAGYNHFHGSLWMGTLGLLATTFYMFLPCFFFVFAGAPLVEGTEDNPSSPGCKSGCISQKSLKDPQVGFVECAYGDGDAQAAGKARRHLDRSYGAAFSARTSVLSAAQ